jgi:hypothetical protein
MLVGVIQWKKIGTGIRTIEGVRFLGIEKRLDPVCGYRSAFPRRRNFAFIVHQQQKKT